MANTDTTVTDPGVIMTWTEVTQAPPEAGITADAIYANLSWGALNPIPRNSIKSNLETLLSKGYLTRRRLQRGTAGLTDVYFLADVQTQLSLDIVPAPAPAPTGK